MRERKRGDAPFLILKYLGDSGPAPYEKISKDLVISPSTVQHDIRNILIKRHGLVKKLYNDEFALKWYIDEEETAKILKSKLLRNPSPEEFAGLIKKSPNEARDLLFQFIPGYRESTPEEILSSQKVIWKMIASEIRPPSKSDLFRKGKAKATFIGLDLETLNDILLKVSSLPSCQSNDYLKKFPEMVPKIMIEDKGDQMIYKIEWGDEVKKILHNIDSWGQTAEIKIPLKFEGKVGGESHWDRVKIFNEMAEIYAPSPWIIIQLLESMGLPGLESDVLIVLKKFCQNALEVDIFDGNIKQDIASSLKDAAFVDTSINSNRNYKNKTNSIEERNIAFEIIEMLDIRNQDVIDLAKDYVFKEIRELSSYENISGPNIFKVAKWIARDPPLKSILMKEISEALEEEVEYTSLDLCIKLLKQLNS